jgi:hypothetical protein
MMSSDEKLSPLEVLNKWKNTQGKASKEDHHENPKSTEAVQIPSVSLSESSATEGSRYEDEGSDLATSEIQLELLPIEPLNTATAEALLTDLPVETTEPLSADLPVESPEALFAGADLKNGDEALADPLPADPDDSGNIEPSWNDANTVVGHSAVHETTQPLCEPQAMPDHSVFQDQADIGCNPANMVEEHADIGYNTANPVEDQPCGDSIESMEECPAPNSSPIRPEDNDDIEFLAAEIKVDTFESTIAVDDHAQLFQIDTVGTTVPVESEMNVVLPLEKVAKLELEEEVIEEETCEEGTSIPISIETKPEDIPVQSNDDIHKYDPVHTVRFFTPESEMANCPNGSKMWVGNLPIGYNDREELASIFGRYGDILDISFGNGKITGYSKIQFVTTESCVNACKKEDRRLMQLGFKLGICILT